VCVIQQLNVIFLLQSRIQFGYFKCLCGHSWESGQVWEGKRQTCKKCNRDIHPQDTTPLQGSEYNGGLDNHNPHIEELCEMCNELGYNCKSFSPKNYRQSDTEADKFIAFSCDDGNQQEGSC